MGAAEIDIEMPGPAPAPAFVGRYRIRGEIASGGMASVYLGVSESESQPGALRAIKRVHPHLAQHREFVEMFVDEARIASRIRHANVCAVLEWGESEGTFFLAMELLSGEPLVSLLRRLKARPELLEDPRWHRAVARIVAHACAGLHAAHELRDDEGDPMLVVHRDVSPHNLFVTWDGVTKVVDFGVASAKHRLHHTTTGTVKGKFAYMSPEQLQGLPVDRRADVWSLGVVLWELLAGRPLFRRTVETETIIAVLNESIPSLEKVRPAAPRELEAIARRAMIGDLDRRTATAGAMQAELEAWLESQGGCTQDDVATLLADMLPGEKDTALARVERALVGATAITPARHAEPTPPTGAKVSGVQRKVDPPRRGRWLAAMGIAALVVAGSAAAWHALPGEPDSVPRTALGPAPLSGTMPAPAIPLAAAAPPSLPGETRARASVQEDDDERAGTRASEGAGAGASEGARAGTGERAREGAGEAARAGEAAAEGAAPAATADPAAVGDTRRSLEAAARHGAERAARALAAAPAEDDGSGTGELDIATPGGWAEVWMDGARLGHTPGRFHLPSGRHTLVLRPGDGGPERTASVRIVGGQLARLRVDLAR